MVGARQRKVNGAVNNNAVSEGTGTSNPTRHAVPVKTSTIEQAGSVSTLLEYSIPEIRYKTRINSRPGQIKTEM